MLHGKPRNTGRRDIERERGKMGVTWGELCKMAGDRDAFRVKICSFCSSGTLLLLLLRHDNDDDMLHIFQFEIISS